MSHSAQIEQFLLRLCPFTQAEVDAFVPQRHEVTLATGDYFVAAGNVCRQIAFVHQGAFSFLIPTPDGQQHVKDFSLDGKFLTAYTSLITQEPSLLSIRAETQCFLSVWPHELYQQLTSQYLHWSQFSRQIADYLFLRKEQRELSLLLESAEERYHRLLHTDPQITQTVPQYLIAAYLGIQPETLSRIRRKLTADGS